MPLLKTKPNTQHQTEQRKTVWDYPRVQDAKARLEEINAERERIDVRMVEIRKLKRSPDDPAGQEFVDAVLAGDDITEIKDSSTEKYNAELKQLLWQRKQIKAAITAQDSRLRKEISDALRELGDSLEPRYADVARRKAKILDDFEAILVEERELIGVKVSPGAFSVSLFSYIPVRIHSHTAASNPRIMLDKLIEAIRRWKEDARNAGYIK